jgi:hypothetical protein
LNGVRVFCVTGARDLELGLEPRPHNGVERVIVDLQMIRLLDPVPQGFIRGQPGRLPERLFNRSQHLWGQGEDLRC